MRPVAGPTRLVAYVAALVFADGLAPLEATAQLPGKVPRIGVLSGDRRGGSDGCTDSLRRGLSGVAHVEGQTYHLEMRWSEGRVEPFPQLAADLVGRNVDLIVATTALAVPAARRATSTIPVVMASSSYPVEQGIIASLARPGGNVTGLAVFAPGLMAKRLQLLKEALPSASRVAILRLSGGLQDIYVTEIETGAQQFGIKPQVIEVRRSEDLPGAFQAAVRGRAQAIMSTQGPFFNQASVQIAELALKHRLPTLSGEPRAADGGSLLFYGPDIYEGCHRAATYVDRILKGAKPADLPVEQPTEYELVINLKTARALGLALPQTLVYRADRVID